MEKELERELKKQLSKLKELENRTERVIKAAPEGKLRFAINKGSYQYYIGKQYQNKKKRKVVQKMAQKEYCEDLLMRIKKQRGTIEKLISILEHLGMLDKPTYFENAMRKLDTNVLEEYVERYLE